MNDGAVPRREHLPAPEWFRQGIAIPGSSGTVTVREVRINYRVWGDPGRPGVVLIHGSNAHLEWWRFVAPFLADRFRIAALDLSGNGDSGWRERYTGETFAAEVRAVMEAADLGAKPFVIGHSFGGFVALETAHRYGEQLGGVIFNDFTVSPPESHTEWGRRAEREGRTEPRRLRVYDELETAVGRFRLLPEQPVRYPDVHRWVAERSLRRVEGGWTWKFDPALFDHLEMGAEQRDKFAALACRSALVLGEHSQDDGARSAPYMHELSRGVLPIIPIPNTHHHMMFEDPISLTMAFKGLLLAWRQADHADVYAAAMAEVLG